MNDTEKRLTIAKIETLTDILKKLSKDIDAELKATEKAVKGIKGR